MDAAIPAGRPAVTRAGYQGKLLAHEAIAGDELAAVLARVQREGPLAPAA